MSVWFLFLALLLVYLSPIAFIYAFQKRIIFQPSHLKKDYNFLFDNHFKEYFISTKDGIQINALLFETEQVTKGLILYFHGNADNLKRWGKYSIDYTRLGFDVLMVDFRGFGKSTGIPTEKDLYSDASMTLAWIKKNLHKEYSKFIIYGRSLGAAVATELASKTEPDLLILETPFDSVHGAISKALKPLIFPFPLQYRFENSARISKINCKIVIFQGTRDRIVPLSSASQLIPLLKKEDEFIIIPKGRHRNLRKFGLFHIKLGETLSKI